MSEKSTEGVAPKPSVWRRELVGISWTLAFIVFLRIYILEPYVIPSESMVPTLLIGDHVFVARGAYDFKVPLVGTTFLKVSDPKRGDVVVFDYPVEDSDDAGKFFVKRVIGIPGDRVELRGGLPYLNGTAFVQEPVSKSESDEKIPGFAFQNQNLLFREQVPDARAAFHWTHRMPERYEHQGEVIDLLRSQTGRSCVEIGSLEARSILATDICPAVVPDDSYFVMGDNRDNSSDSRVFGFVHRRFLKGRVLFIWFSPPPGEVNPYTSGPAIFAALKDMVPGLFRMLRDSGRLGRLGDSIR